MYAQSAGRPLGQLGGWLDRSEVGCVLGGVSRRIQLGVG